jgi:hypothetical protein
VGVRDQSLLVACGSLAVVLELRREPLEVGEILVPRGLRLFEPCRDLGRRRTLWL